VGQHAEVALTRTAVVGTPGHGAAEPALVSAERALDLPPLAEHALVPGARRPGPESAGHLGTIPPARLALMTARVNRDHAGPDAEHLTREPVVGFGVERGIGQHPVPGQTQRRQEQDRRELWGIVGRAGGHRGPSEEVGMGVGRDGELGPRAGRVFALGPGDEVPRRVPAIQPGCIDGDGWDVRDQARIDSGRDGPFEEVEEDPPFRSRASALQSVE
jgi:hypothetical protein